eukprot:scaffold110362_cov63-Phaeocystis_antarctica.AAC.1
MVQPAWALLRRVRPQRSPDLEGVRPQSGRGIASCGTTRRYGTALSRQQRLRQPILGDVGQRARAFLLQKLHGTRERCGVVGARRRQDRPQRLVEPEALRSGLVARQLPAAVGLHLYVGGIGRVIREHWPERGRLGFVILPLSKGFVVGPEAVAELAGGQLHLVLGPRDVQRLDPERGLLPVAGGEHDLLLLEGACMVKGGEIGGFGGGWLEHPRRWLGAQRAGLSPGSTEPPRAARRALRRHRSRAAALSRGHFDHAEARSTRNANWLPTRADLLLEMAVILSSTMVPLGGCDATCSASSAHHERSPGSTTKKRLWKLSAP